MLQGKHILLGVTGSIAAYKAAVLCRLLKAAGADRVMGLTVARKGGNDGRSREFYELFGHGMK